MKVIILLVSLMMAGCEVNETECRVVCTNFETEWMDFAGVHDGLVSWSDNSGTIRGVRKMIPGEICIREIR